MVTIDDVLKKVIELRNGHAAAALSKPKNRDAFEYGKQSGMYVAFETVREEIARLLEEDAKTDRLEENDDERSKIA